MKFPLKSPQGFDWLADSVRPFAGGGQGVVYRVKRDGDARSYVLKTLKPNHGRDPVRALNRFRVEVGVLRALNGARCPNIVEVVDSNLDGEPPWFVMPYYSEGALRGKNGKFIERLEGNISRTLEIVSDLAKALAFMHEDAQVFGHRDVKTGNVFFEKVGGPAVLGDFGLAYEFGSKRPADTPVGEKVGPGFWVAPELRKGGPAERYTQSDIYLLGGLLYECLTGGETITETERFDGTFAHLDAKLAIDRYTNGDPRTPFVNDMLRGMFRRVPTERISARTVGELCRQIKEWGPGMDEPKLPRVTNAIEEASREFRTRPERVRYETIRSELRKVCDRIAAPFPDIGKNERGHAWVGVEVNVGDGPPSMSVQRQFGNVPWCSIRIRADFEYDSSRVLRFGYVVLVRPDTDTEVYGFTDDRTEDWKFLGEGPVGSPTIVEGMRNAVSKLRTEYEAWLVDAIRKLK